MSWTKTQCDELFEQIWTTGGATCPRDGAILRVDRSVRPRGEYTLLAQCPRCGGHLRLGRADDPRRSELRLWRDAEKEQLVDAHFQQHRPACPVDGAPVEVREVATFHATVLFLRCVRCGNAHQATFAYENDDVEGQYVPADAAASRQEAP